MFSDIYKWKKRLEISCSGLHVEKSTEKVRMRFGKGIFFNVGRIME